MDRTIVLVDLYWTRDKDPRVPLGHASFQQDVAAKGQPHRAAGYGKDPAGAVVSATEDAHYWKHGAGGYKSNVRDFARWARAVLARELVTYCR